MRKNTSFLLLAFLAPLLIACGGSTSSTAKKALKIENSDLKKEELQGNVDSLRQRVFWAVEKFGRIEKGKRQNMATNDYLKVFDKYGFLTQEVHYDVNDVVVSMKNLLYDADHKLIKEELYKGEKLDETIAYTYNNEKQLEKKERFTADGKTKDIVKYVYYDNGLLMDEDICKADGTLSVKYVYVYEGEKLIEKQKYWSGGTLAEKELYSYDLDGNLMAQLTEKYQNKVAQFVKRSEFVDYTSFGKYRKKIDFDANHNEVAYYAYEYDTYGNLIEYAPFTYFEVALDSAGDEVADSTANAANEEGIEEESEEAAITSFRDIKQGTGAMYEYEYDGNMNWTRKVTYKVEPNQEKARQFYYERVITYGKSRRGE